jgi:hypothetical protein
MVSCWVCGGRVVDARRRFVDDGGVVYVWVCADCEGEE